MRLANYINDLLYRYECVIVPGFGGFITNEISSSVDHYTHTFHPPMKQVSFNSNLQNNDGLLANHISSIEKVSFNEAMNIINKETKQWNDLLINETVEISKIGSLRLNEEHKIIFDPSHLENYLTSSFGLNTFNSAAIKRLEYKEQVRKLEAIAPIINSEEKRRKTPIFLKYAASLAILFAVGSFGWKAYDSNQYQKQLIAEQHQQNLVEQKIQEATFVIKNPLPAITLNIAKETSNYHVIAGAFREPGNAERKVHQLIEKGYNAQILGTNKWNLLQVSYASFSNKNDALNSLRSIKRTIASDAWLLVQEF